MKQFKIYLKVQNYLWEDLDSVGKYFTNSIPESLIDAIKLKGVKDLTIVSNNAGNFKLKFYIKDYMILV